jgi:hypothetical protein
MANERVQASEAKAQLRLQEQTQRAEMLISELRQALTETADDQDVANTRAAAEMEVHLRKELLEAKRRLAELELAWEMFIAKHNDEEEAQESEQRRRASHLPNVALVVSKIRQIASSYEWRRVCHRPSDAAATTSQLATPRGVDNNLSGARDPGSASTLGMFSPTVSTGLDSAREPGPSTATVNSNAARITEINRGIHHGRVQETHQESTGSSSAHPLRREELIPDSMLQDHTH